MFFSFLAFLRFLNLLTTVDELNFAYSEVNIEGINKKGILLHSGLNRDNKAKDYTDYELKNDLEEFDLNDVVEQLTEEEKSIYLN